MASLQSIFNQFDLDRSGYIDSSQLKEVAKKLGDSLSDKDLKELMSGIDTNRDGKISYQEFKEWWIKGHKGRLNDLIILKSKSLKAIDAVKDKFKQKGLSFQNYKATQEKDTASINVTFGDNRFDVNPSISDIKIGFAYGADEYKNVNEKLDMKNPFLDESRLSLTVKFETDQPKKLQKLFREVILEVLDTLAFSMGIYVKYEELEKNDYLQIKIEANQKQNYLLLYIEPGNMVKDLIDQILKAQEALSQKSGEAFEARAQIQFSVFTSLKEILSKNKNLVEAFMQGCSFNISASMTSSAAKMLKQFFFKDSRQTEAILITLTRNLKLDFKIRTPEKLEEFFKKLGIWETVSQLPSFRDLLDIITPELQAMKDKTSAGQRDQIPFFTAILKFLKAVTTYSNPGVSFILQKKSLALFGFIDGEGLKDLYDVIVPK